MSETVKINLILQAKGVKETVEETSQIASNMDKATASANKYSAAMAGAVKATSSKSIPSNMLMTPSMATAAPKTNSVITEQEYGKVRGAVGTGAAGRDFAKQAQGLGGLVALYATFAANIFAVGAAYEALNKAAATERLAKATEMMSVSVGVNLKTVSKNLVEASGYALSFQDAMQFTNIGTSAGLASSQIESLTKIAKGAAVALGRDVGDSVRRIIQGTAKQEQEILDELGIFIKASQAYEKFAAANKIKVADLTGAQRTQAYANEVERLGKKWNEFAEIPDPFSKFAATGKNALNELLTAINSVIGPIVGLLAESKEGVQALIVLISTSLVKRAIPELGSLFNNLFNYDKTAATAKAKEATDNLNAINARIASDFATANAKLKALRLEQLSLVVPTVDKSSVSSSIGVAGNVVGKNKEYGLSSIRLTNVLKEAEATKSLLATQQSVQKVIEAQLKDKAKDAVEQQKMFEAFKIKGLVEKESTITNITLGKEALRISEAQYLVHENINKTLARKMELAVLEKLQLAEVSKIERSLNNLGSGKTTIAKASASMVTSNNVTVITSNTAVAASVNNIATAESRLAAVREKGIIAANLLNQAAGVGVLESLKAAITGISGIMSTAWVSSFGKATLSTNATIISISTLDIVLNKLKVTLVTGILATLLKFTWIEAMLVNLSKAGILASGAFKSLGIGVSFLGKALLALSGPIMIAWTVWELFGTTIKKWLGFSDESTEKLEESVTSFKEYAEGTAMAAKSLDKANQARKNQLGSIEESISLNKLELNALQSHVDAYTKILNEKVRNAELAAIALAKANAAKNKGPQYSESAEFYKELSNTEGLSTKLAGEANVLSISLQKLSDKQLGMATDSKEFIEIEKQKLELEKAGIIIAQEVLVVKQQQDSQLNKLKASSASITEVLEKETKARLKLGDTDLGLKTEEAVKIYRSFENILSASVPTEVKFAQTTEALAQVISNGGAGAEIAKEAYINLFKAKLLAIAAGKDGKLDSTILEEEIAKLNGINKALAQRFNSLGKSTKAIKPYDDESKRQFKALQDEIDLTAIKMKQLATEEKTDSALQSRLTAINGVVSAESVANDKMYRDKQAQLTLDKEMIDAKLALERVLQNRTNKGPEGKQAIEDAKAVYVSKLQSLGLTKIEADVLSEIKLVTDLISKATADRNIELKRTTELLTIENGHAQQRLDAQIAELNYAKELGYMTSQEIVDAEYLLEVEHQKQALKNSQSSLTDKYASDTSQYVSVLSTEKSTPEDKAAAVAKILEINALYQLQNALILSGAEGLAKQTAKAQELKAALAGNADQMKLMTDLTDSLTGAFGELGTNVGKAGEALLKMAQDDEKYSRDKLVIQEKINLASIAGYDTTDLIKEHTKIDKKASKDKLANIGAVAGATKKMFAEQTGAYKLLDGLEKASHIMQMVNMAKELGTMLSGLATSIAAMFTEEAAVGAAKVPNVLMSFVEWLGPWGVAAGAAFLASIGMSSGGASAQTFVPNAEQMQQTQGTGMSWDSEGKLVENGGGVFGDAEAKSNSMVNSLELIRETSVAGLKITSKSENLLEKINKGIEKVAIGLYSVSGLRGGSISGTIEKSISSPGFLGLFASSSSTSIINSGIQLQGTFTDLALAGKGVVRAFETVQNTKTKSGFLGIGASSKTSINTNYAGLPPELLEDISSIFGNATELFQEQASIVSNMSVDSVNSVLAGVKVDKLASLRGLSGIALQEELSAVLSSILDDAAAELFPKFKEFRKFGEGFSQTVTRVVDGFDKVNLALESIGMATISVAEVTSKATPEMYAAVATNEAAIQAAKAAIPKAITIQVDSNDFFPKTVITNSAEIATAEAILTTSTKLYTASLEILNEANSGMTINNYAISESLINASGGLENFLNSVEEFSDRFLTETERMDFKAKKVSETMYNLGKSILNVQEGYTKVDYIGSATIPTSMKPGESQDKLWEEIITSNWDAHVKYYGIGWDTFRTTEEERQATYLHMLSQYNARNIATYTPVAEVITETNSYAIEMFKTFSDGNDGIIDTKNEFKKLVQGIDKTIPEGEALYIELTKIQGAFADVAEAAGDTGLQKAEDILKQVYDNRKKELEDLINGWSRVNEIVLKFIDSLKQGSLSPLSPQQKFALAKQEYNAALKAINDPSTDPKARLKAAEGFTGLADTLLQTGKILFASSGSYTSLFDKVISDSTSVADQASTLETGFTTELSALNTMAEILGIIEAEVTKSTDFQGAIKDYLTVKYTADVYDAVMGAYEAVYDRTGFGTTAETVDVGGAEYWMQKALAGEEIMSSLVQPGLATGNSNATAWYLEDKYGEVIYDKVMAAYNSIYDRTGFGTTSETVDVGGAIYWMEKMLNGESGLFSQFLQPGIATGVEKALDAYAQVGPEASFAVGTNYVPRDMIAQIHEGERIIPAADNAMLMQSFSNRNENERVLVDEIRKLRKEVEELRNDQHKQTGDLIRSNFDANQVVADKVGETSKDRSWQERSKAAII